MVDGAHDARMLALELVGDGTRAVRRSVVHDDDLVLRGVSLEHADGLLGDEANRALVLVDGAEEAYGEGPSVGHQNDSLRKADHGSKRSTAQIGLQ